MQRPPPAIATRELSTKAEGPNNEKKEARPCGDAISKGSRAQSKLHEVGKRRYAGVSDKHPATMN